MAKVNQINNHSKVENQSDSEPEIFIGAILQSNYSDNKIWDTSLSTNSSEIVYKIDTGAEVNVISKAEFNTLKRKPKLSDTNIKLTAYNNTKIPIAGECELSIERLVKSFNLPFIVVEVSSPSILSANLSTQLKLVK